MIDLLCAPAAPVKHNRKNTAASKVFRRRIKISLMPLALINSGS
jgi:hypothetical protein